MARIIYEKEGKGASELGSRSMAKVPLGAVRERQAPHRVPSAYTVKELDQRQARTETLVRMVHADANTGRG